MPLFQNEVLSLLKFKFIWEMCKVAENESFRKMTILYKKVQVTNFA